MTKEERLQAKFLKLALIIINFTLVIGAIFFAFDYTKNIEIKRHEAELSNFCETIETMKSISERYFEIEKMSLYEWEEYIENNDLSKKEALEYIKTITKNNDSYANIVDMDTYNAWSSTKNDLDEECVTYAEFFKYSEESKKMFLDNLETMFTNDDNDIILGKFLDIDAQTTVVAQGTSVSLRQEDGSFKDYLLLRMIPVSSVMKMWVFPTSYSDGEIGLITASGDYVIQSRSMRSQSFYEFIFSYNIDDEAAKPSNLVESLKDNSSKLFTFKNSKGEECYWYYSKLSNNSSVGIIGTIPIASFDVNKDYSLYLILIICAIIGILVIIDGSYAIYLNNKLRKAVKIARDASNAKTQFLSSMSHDIRTPMNAVIGVATLAKRNIDDKEYVKTSLDKILLSGNLLLTLINDILDISKIESGKIVIRKEEFSLSDLLVSLEAIIRPQAEVKGILFNVEKSIDHDCLVGDELRISQIYLNLLTNAVKYTKSNGKVSFIVSQEMVSDCKVRLKVVVEDNGIGMNEEYQKVMYDSFTRETDSRTSKIHGSGLGLYIVKKMIDEMKGTISCQSQVDVGTKFTVCLDLDIGIDKETYKLKELNSLPETADLSNLHILVAEDNDLNWEIIQELLVENKIVCDRAENGELAVRMLSASAPFTYDMVLMDIQMPIMNGLEATKEIRKSKRSDICNLPIIAMTADAFAEDIKACKDAGMNGHLTKPLNFNKVLETIRIVVLQGGFK